jgi:hypothetical protein
MNEVILYHHLGLGDHLICNGLVHTVAESYSQVHLACKRNYFSTVKCLYEDFDNIKVFPIDKEPNDVFAYNNTLKIMRVGFEHVDIKAFEKSFYNQLNIPYLNRFTKFKLPKNNLSSKQFYQMTVDRLGEEYIFVHNESSGNKFDIKIQSNLPAHVVQKSDTNNVLDYVTTICNAKEIHVINSSIFALVVNLYFTGHLNSNKIVYHNIRTIAQGGIPLEVPETFIIEKYIQL